jgi:hypothetical protein
VAVLLNLEPEAPGPEPAIALARPARLQLDLLLERLLRVGRERDAGRTPDGRDTRALRMLVMDEVKRHARDRFGRLIAA